MSEQHEMSEHQHPARGSGDLVPFALDLPAEAVDDLHQRLRRARLPEPETVAATDDEWAQGVPLG